MLHHIPRDINLQSEQCKLATIALQAKTRFFPERCYSVTRFGLINE